MGEGLLMSAKERRRLPELSKVVAGEQRLVDAAAKLGLSYRQAKRVLRRYRDAGDAGLCHRGRGLPSNRARPAGLRQEALAFYRERLEGFGPTLAAEKLLERGLAVDHETLRRWLLEAGLWRRTRRRGAVRRLRERRAHFGELVQMDGSIHDWLGEGRQSCLMVMVDDATGWTLARLFPGETSAAAMSCLWRWIEGHGLPLALYTDLKSVYHATAPPSPAAQLAGEGAPRTAFARSCALLGVELVPAYSPQAKGRVERKNAVLQDRFVKELRLQRIATPEGANALLEGGFLAELNRRFAVAPGEAADYHRAVPEDLDLAEVFAFEEERTVANDWTVRCDNVLYQLLGPGRSLPPSKGKVTLRRRLDGSLRIYYRGLEVSYRLVPAAERERRVQAPKKAAAGADLPRRPWTPPADHPWRRGSATRRPTACVEQ